LQREQEDFLRAERRARAAAAQQEVMLQRLQRTLGRQSSAAALLHTIVENP
jgi:hypothetical protein